MEYKNKKEEFYSKGAKLYDKKLASFEKRERAQRNSGRFKLFALFAVLMIITILFAELFTNGENQKTFASLLQYLQNVPEIIPDDIWGFVDLTIVGEWEYFDGFRQFINSIISIFSFLAWIFKCLVNCIPYFIYLLRWFFV